MDLYFPKGGGMYIYKFYPVNDGDNRTEIYYKIKNGKKSVDLF